MRYDRALGMPSGMRFGRTLSGTTVGPGPDPEPPPEPVVPTYVGGAVRTAGASIDLGAAGAAIGDLVTAKTFSPVVHPSTLRCAGLATIHAALMIAAVPLLRLRVARLVVSLGSGTRSDEEEEEKEDDEDERDDE